MEIAEPPMAADEPTATLALLDRLRGYVGWKCGGLDEDGLRAVLPPSAVTLGGLLKHLTLVEDTHFAMKFLGEAMPSPWDAVDWDGDPDWEWRTAGDDSAADLVGAWEAAVARSRTLLASAVANGGLDQLARWHYPDGRRPNLRRLVLDLIEEYGRHLGHADLIRESVDGLVGEDPGDT